MVIGGCFPLLLLLNLNLNIEERVRPNTHRETEREREREFDKAREERENFLNNQIESYDNRVNIHNYYSNFLYKQCYRWIDVRSF